MSCKSGQCEINDEDCDNPRQKEAFYWAIHQCVIRFVHLEPDVYQEGVGCGTVGWSREVNGYGTRVPNPSLAGSRNLSKSKARKGRGPWTGLETDAKAVPLSESAKRCKFPAKFVVR